MPHNAMLLNFKNIIFCFLAISRPVCIISNCRTMLRCKISKMISFVFWLRIGPNAFFFECCTMLSC
ncbi:hypothetical protein PUN28_020601 [Cardiocondyla obscurior]|uniref:Secreted protein n=1 Tax=Cardiocondyla obscurior TaxID=286306 RepID=A0AAW2E6R1_9HYME